MVFNHGMSTTHRTRPARYYADALAGAYRQAENYRKLAALAAELGMEYEAERANANAAEMDGEADALIDAAASAGYTPDDLQAAGL